MITEKPGKNYVEFKHRHEEEQCLQIGAIHGKINDVARIMSPKVLQVSTKCLRST